MKRKQSLVLASNNPGKLVEINALLAGHSIDVISQSVLGLSSLSEETGQTFLENALAKARYASLQSKRPALADDSGLCVNALNGAPGIFSARYAGVDATDTQNTQQLLQALDGAVDRAAYFYCVLVLVRHAEDPCPFLAQGQCNGHISDQAYGENGFGYDPVFIPEGRSKTLAQVSRAEKNTVSHRAKALRQLCQQIEQVGL